MDGRRVHVFTSLGRGQVRPNVSTFGQVVNEHEGSHNECECRDNRKSNRCRIIQPFPSEGYRIGLISRGPSSDGPAGLMNPTRPWFRFRVTLEHGSTSGTLCRRKEAVGDSPTVALPEPIVDMLALPSRRNVQLGSRLFENILGRTRRRVA